MIFYNTGNISSISDFSFKYFFFNFKQANVLHGHAIGTGVMALLLAIMMILFTLGFLPPSEI